MKKLLPLAISLSLCLSSCGEALNDVLSPPPESVSTEGSGGDGILLDRPARTQFAVYLIGSDLEDGNQMPGRGGAGSSDLNEMVAGYQALSVPEQDNIDVLVGFGGANQAGWQGIKYADMTCLIKDASDGVYGNDDCYAFVDETANMGDHSTLTAFMQAVNQGLRPEDKSLFTFWDHGASYMGVGPDSNHLSNGILTMEDLSTSFKTAQSRFDIIGFDACLMGSVEVAQTVQPYGTYMVASEELEPGHGWDYEDLFQYIGSTPKASAEGIGRKMVDSFIDSPKHRGPHSNIKTLSLVDLRRFPEVQSAIDTLAEQLNGSLDSYYEPFMQAATRAEGYGVQNKGGIEMGIDLVDFAQKLKSLQPDLAASLDALIASLKPYTLYSKRDVSRPNANGVAIFSPRYTAPVQNDLYSESASVSRSWRNYAKAVVEKGTQDNQEPVITQEIDNCADGFHCLLIEDNVGVAEALSMNAIQDPENSNEYIITSTINMNITADKASGSYGLFIWDGSVEALCNGPCADDYANAVGIPAHVENLTEEGKILASADGFLNGQEVVYYFLAGEQGVEDFWAVPFSQDANGNVIISREQFALGQGDKIQFSNARLNVETGSLSYETDEGFTLSAEPVFESVQLPGEKFYFAVASDLKGNVAVSQPRFVTD